MTLEHGSLRLTGSPVRHRDPLAGNDSYFVLKQLRLQRE